MKINCRAIIIENKKILTMFRKKLKMVLLKNVI